MANVQNLDLNRASVEEIANAGIAQVSEERARDLVEYRDEHGSFDSWEELQDVPGFNQGMIDNLKEAGVTLGNEESAEDNE